MVGIAGESQIRAGGEGGGVFKKVNYCILYKKMKALKCITLGALYSRVLPYVVCSMCIVL